MHNLIEFVVEIMRVVFIVVVVYIFHIISLGGGYAKSEHFELHLVSSFAFACASLFIYSNWCIELLII